MEACDSAYILWYIQVSIITVVKSIGCARHTIWMMDIKKMLCFAWETFWTGQMKDRVDKRIVRNSVGSYLMAGIG
jgi:hypothetical protein